MLRKAVIVLGVGLLIAGAASALAGVAPLTVFFVVNGLVLTLGVVYERWHYKRLAERVQPDWEASGERFVDPETGRLTEVYYDKRDQTRHYVARPKG